MREYASAHSSSAKYSHVDLRGFLCLQDLTVLGLKKLIHEQRPDLPPYKQKLVCRSSGPRPLEDERKLASFPGLQNRSVINLIVQVPWEIYLQAADGKLHTVEIPSSNPNVSMLHVSILCILDYNYCICMHDL